MTRACAVQTMTLKGFILNSITSIKKNANIFIPHCLVSR